MSQRLGDILLKRGLVAKEKLLVALQEQTITKERLGKILVRNGFIRQNDLLPILSEINSNTLHDESTFQNVIPAKLLLDTRSMVVACIGNTLYLGTRCNPEIVRRRIAPCLKGYDLAFTGVNPIKLQDYLGKLGSSDVASGMSWERLFHDAMNSGSSDIHIIPRQASFTVMNRRDGVLHPVYAGALDEYIALVSRIKDLAKMDMAERRRPQDGGYSMTYSGRVVNFRIVTVPTTHGERLVVRILDPDAVNLKLDSLGITRVDVWRRATAKADGLCLICGPTGSGKSTTLSASVREMNFLERAIYSAEDPVEYELPYAGQVSVNPAVGLDFSNSVRTFMRADPDVILVGEIRDADTARNALKAAETGHLVLATLHTNSILTAIGRLRDIGIAPYELLHLLRGIMVQRLMRTYCPACHGEGCVICSGSGYKGRQCVSEVACFETVADVQAVIDGVVSWPTMMQDAKNKVLSRTTSAAEFERVFGYKLSEVA